MKKTHQCSVCTSQYSLFKALIKTTLPLIAACAIIVQAHAEQLDIVSELNFDGTEISWSPVDRAIGYNVYRNGFYLDTLFSQTTYVPLQPGEYRIIAFDGEGNYSPISRWVDGNTFEFADTVMVEGALPALRAPQNLRGIVYSKTAGELFWDTDSALNLRYVVSLNGDDGNFVIRGVTVPGNSFWFADLPENAITTATVYSQTPDGRRSPGVSISFDTTGDSYPIPAVVTGTPGEEGTDSNNISPFTNVRVEVYSQTAAELFWDTPPLDEQVTSVEVYRDGVFLGRTYGLGANSFFDPEREPGVAHSYELVAFNDVSERAVVATIDSEAFYDAQNLYFKPVLEGITELVRTGSFSFGYNGIFQLLGGDTPDGFDQMSTDEVDIEGVAGTRAEYACAEGSLIVETTGMPVGVSVFDYSDCLFFGNRFNGQVTVVIDGETGLAYENYDDIFGPDAPETVTIVDNGVDFTESFTYEDFTIESPGSFVVINGEEANFYTVEYGDGVLYDRVICGSTRNDFNVVRSDSREAAPTFEWTLNQDMAYSSEQPVNPGTFTTEFSVVAPWTQGQVLNVSTVNMFAGEFDPGRGYGTDYSSGMLFAESSNGDNLTVTADTGDNRTWFAEATTSLGSFSATEQWGLLFDLPYLDEDCAYSLI